MKGSRFSGRTFRKLNESDERYAEKALVEIDFDNEVKAVQVDISLTPVLKTAWVQPLESKSAFKVFSFQLPTCTPTTRT